MATAPAGARGISEPGWRHRKACAGQGRSGPPFTLSELPRQARTPTPDHLQLCAPQSARLGKPDTHYCVPGTIGPLDCVKWILRVRRWTIEECGAQVSVRPWAPRLQPANRQPGSKVDCGQIVGGVANAASSVLRGEWFGRQDLIQRQTKRIRDRADRYAISHNVYYVRKTPAGASVQIIAYDNPVKATRWPQ